MATWPNEIEDDFLLIRAWKLGDESRLAQLLDHPMIYDLSPYGPTKLRADLLEEQIRRQIEDSQQLRFVIIPREFNQIVGTVGCQKMLNDRLEIGFWTGFKYWNQGYMKRAVGRVVNAAMKSCQYERLEARCFERNLASAHILRKAGFNFEGRIPDFSLFGRPPEPLLTFGITDCRASKDLVSESSKHPPFAISMEK